MLVTQYYLIEREGAWPCIWQHDSRIQNPSLRTRNIWCFSEGEDASVDNQHHFFREAAASAGVMNTRLMPSALEASSPKACNNAIGVKVMPPTRTKRKHVGHLHTDPLAGTAHLPTGGSRTCKTSSCRIGNDIPSNSLETIRRLEFASRSTAMLHKWCNVSGNFHLP